MTDLPVMPAEVTDAARHGSYCPKLCTFACPVSEATGRDDAVPWSFHRTVSDLADGRLAPQEAAPRLTACSGCLACRQPCVFDQDVPAQVVAARAVAMPQTEPSERALVQLALGRRPDGTSTPAPIGNRDADVVVVAGHADTREAMQAALRLFSAAGVDVAVIAPDGCCGALPRALGQPGLATGLTSQLATQVGTAKRVVGLDPHCLSELRQAAPNADVIDVATALAELLDRLRFRSAGRTLAWHDPCVLSRGEGVTDPPRRLLAAAGFTLAEPEDHRSSGACSGAGLGMPLLDPEAAAATAVRRARQLRVASATSASSCRRAADLLAANGAPTEDLVILLADLLEDD